MPPFHRYFKINCIANNFQVVNLWPISSIFTRPFLFEF